MAINRTVNSVDYDDKENIVPTSRDQNVVVVVELASVNILDELTIKNLLGQFKRLLDLTHVWPDINAATRLRSDVRHLALGRGLEDGLS